MLYTREVREVMRRLKFLSVLISLAVVLAVFASWPAPAAAGQASAGAERAQVVQATNVDMSPELRSIPAIAPQPAAYEIENWPRLPGGGVKDQDALVQDQSGSGELAPTIANFDGLDNVNNIIPPDITGAVGPNHYVQWINLSFQIFTKSGTSVYGPANGNTLWQGFAGPCGLTNNGDPMVMYDHLADRWFLTQFALPNFPDGPFYQCIAVSTTGDPLGSYYRYEYLISTTKFHDPPKFGVWPDGYYMAANLLQAPTMSWAGAGVYVFDRVSMLNGGPATMQYFELPATDWGNLLPADLDGPEPPAGSPNYMLEVVDGAWDPVNWPQDALHLHRFHVDWNNPANTTFNIEPIIIPVAPFDGTLCSFQRNCIPQKSSNRRLDALSNGLMYRLQYRNFGDHESLVVNHTVNVGGDRAGIRWYEVRNPGGTPVVYQQGTFAPNDGLSRWLGSIAMDKTGNIGLGYNVSGITQDPSIYYTGRLATDPLGQFGLGEGVIVEGTGAQTYVASRWGDYSTMDVDPVDGCTFWYMSEYIATTGIDTWRTRIASFTFPSCAAPTAVQSTAVTATATAGLPVAAVAVLGITLIGAITVVIMRRRRN